MAGRMADPANQAQRRAISTTRLTQGRAREVSLIFWGLTLAMLVAAIGFVVVPIRKSGAASSRLSVGVLILVPTMAAGFYTSLGTPEAITAVFAHQARTGAAQSSSPAGVKKPVGSVASMLDGLKARLEHNPVDAGSWLLLAKSYRHLGRPEEANAAYEKARALGVTDDSFEQAAGNGVARPTAGMANAGPSIRGRLTLSPNAATLVHPNDTVFIFAKESADQRMPVVAQRFPASSLPLDFDLTDRDVMVAGTSIARFDHLIVTAKVSRSGLATEVVDGLEVWSDPVTPTNGPFLDLLLTAGDRNE